MSQYVITCESTVDLSEAHLRERAVSFACFTFHMDGKEYSDDYGRSMPITDFYEKLKQGSVSTTSQVSIGAYEALWKPFLEEEKDVLHIALSSGISGSYQAACLAAGELRDLYPSRRIVVIDSLSASSGYGLLIDLACDRRDADASIAEVRNDVLALRHRINAWFYTSDLTYLCRGGRVSKTAFVLGTALRICPLLRIDQEGKLVPAAKYRGKKRTMEACAEKMLERADGGKEYDGYCYISQSACREDAEALKSELERLFPHLQGDHIRIFDIGAVIGSHTGPGTVALFFLGTPKE